MTVTHLRLLVTVISLLGLILACPDGGSSSSGSVTPEPVKYTPKASDYTVTPIDRNFIADGTAKSVTVTPKSGATVSPDEGYKTPKYNGETTAPSAVGLYEITIDLAASGDWEAYPGLLVGSMAIKNPGKDDLVVANFDLSDFPNGTARQDISETRRPVVRPGPGISSDVTIADITTYYGGSTTFPTTGGTYAVTFNVRETNKYNPIAGLSAGLLVLTDPSQETKVTMVGAEDFNVLINGVVQTGSAAGPNFDVDFINAAFEVTLTNKGSKAYPLDNPDNVDIKYWTAGGVMIAEPKDVGVYTVKVKLADIVQPGATWNGPAFDFTMTIKKRTPVPEDFDLGIDYGIQSEAGTFLGQPITVHAYDIAFKDKYTTTAGGLTDSTTGLTINITYTAADGTVYPIPAGPGGTPAAIPVPQTAGNYAVTFDIVHTNPSSPTNTNWIVPTTGLNGGTLVVKPLQPVIPQIGTKFWIDDDSGILTANVQKASNGKYQLAVNPGTPISFTFDNKKGYTDVKWFEDGTTAPAANIAGSTYTFRKYAIGWHTVTIVVTAPPTTDDNGDPVLGKVYSETVEIRVQTN